MRPDIYTQAFEKQGSFRRRMQSENICKPSENTSCGSRAVLIDFPSSVTRSVLWIVRVNNICENIILSFIPSYMSALNLIAELQR